jgi:hypothetical protein
VLSSNTGFYSGCDDEDEEKHTDAPAAKGGKAGSPSKLCPDGRLFSMTVTEMSNWLTSNGHQTEVGRQGLHCLVLVTMLL